MGKRITTKTKGTAFSLLLYTTVLWGSSAWSADDGVTDRDFPPVLEVDSSKIYDNANSVPNPELVKESARLNKPIDDFMRYLAKAVDSGSDLKRPYEQLESWAQAGACLR